jgi:hypothetical protein
MRDKHQKWTTCYSSFVGLFAFTRLLWRIAMWALSLRYLANAFQLNDMEAQLKVASRMIMPSFPLLAKPLAADHKQFTTSVHAVRHLGYSIVHLVQKMVSFFQGVGKSMF